MNADEADTTLSPQEYIQYGIRSSTSDSSTSESVFDFENIQVKRSSDNADNARETKHHIHTPSNASTESLQGSYRFAGSIMTSSSGSSPKEPDFEKESNLLTQKQDLIKELAVFAKVDDIESTNIEDVNAFYKRLLQNSPLPSSASSSSVNTGKNSSPSRIPSNKAEPSFTPPKSKLP